MLVLIELFDMNEPVHNIISLSAFQPDHMEVICRGEKDAAHAKCVLGKYIRSAEFNTQIEYHICSPFELESAEKTIEIIIDKYGAKNCMIDIIGGNEMLLLAVGAAVREKDVRIVTQLKHGYDFVWLKGEPAAPKNPDFQISVGQAIALAGGELTRNARVKKELFQSEFMKLVPVMFDVYMKHRSQWPSFVLYLQRLNRPEYEDLSKRDERCFCVPKTLYSGKKRLNPKLGIFNDLKAAGALNYIYEEASHYCMQFSSDEMLKYLCDVGSWLELYTYHLFKRCGFFGDVQISAVISWDGDSDREDVINEIDLIATEGKGQLFISCKTALPDTPVLNEIAALVSRFGSAYAIPVIVTASDLEREAPGVYRRAAEMGIAIFDKDDLNEHRFKERIQQLRMRWT